MFPNFAFPKIILPFLTALIIFSLRATALAHSVVVFGWEKEGIVHTQSKFSGGGAIKQGRIRVFDSSGDLLLHGTTDDHGEFSFKPPLIATLTVVLTSGGHRAEWEFKPKNKSAGAEADKRAGVRRENNGELTQEDIRLIVEKAVDKKLDPLLKTLAEQSVSQVTFKDIVGGLGYIMGLVGLAAYFQYKKNRSP